MVANHQHTSTYRFLRWMVLSAARAAPLHLLEGTGEPKPAEDPSKWAYLGTAVALVLLGGAFAGLTIALMGQDEIYLQVIATSGEKYEKKNAKKVLGLLKRGKHWVLVTLLLSNVITNETLPIVLDRSLGGGWPAVLSSTILIVIFGEIVPQSICVRYGLPIGAWMSPFVLGLMWIMSPVAFPTARLLDWLLGEDHGTTYKKAGLKTLVTLHKSIGPSPSDRLNEDEVTIISAVLDLKDKPVGNIMTPMNDVFTLSANAVLDEKMMDTILSAGYSRIPIYEPGNQSNFVGMLLVKMLITYDPEDAHRVRDFALATLPETRPETSCLDIVNFFQEGKSHMVLVSDFPGEPSGALGVVTLEDVIEELIGEEIIDESDVFVDVHKAIRRLTPAPRTRVPKGEIVTDHDGSLSRKNSELADSEATIQPRASEVLDMPEPKSTRKGSFGELGVSPKPVTFLMRRRSDGMAADTRTTTPFRGDASELREHLRHLGPSNAASHPKQTRISSVKIKKGDGRNEDATVHGGLERNDSTPLIPKAVQGGIGQGVVTAGRDAKDGTHAVQQGYGTMGSSPSNAGMDGGIDNVLETVHEAPTQEDLHKSTAPSPTPAPESAQAQAPAQAPSQSPEQRVVIEFRSPSGRIEPEVSENRGHVSLQHSRSPNRTLGGVRSGSITENTVDIGGVKKLVLETTSSSDNEGGPSSGSPKDHRGSAGGAQEESAEVASPTSPQEGKAAKKNRRKRGGKKNKRKGSKGGEEGAPLLGDG